MKEKLEQYFKERIKYPEDYAYVIHDCEDTVLWVEFDCVDICFSWEFLQKVHDIFPYRAIREDKGKFRFEG